MSATLEQVAAELARVEARLNRPEPGDDPADLFLYRSMLRYSLKARKEAAARDQLAADRGRLDQPVPLRKAVELVVRAFRVLVHHCRLGREGVALRLGHSTQKADHQALKGEDTRALAAAHIVERKHSDLSVLLHSGDDAESGAAAMVAPDGAPQ